ncbi:MULTISPECIES: DUF1150 family protein [unclassified Yoonia]|uniref:DUF1150 family protein n=1 Tax=unclassified Yoonia TaxID=2629118 RepID=UPI003727A611
MNTKFDLKSMGEDIVYVKAIAVTELPQELQQQAGDLDTLFSVHNAQGEQLALVANRKLAFHLARENHMRPVTVH